MPRQICYSDKYNDDQFEYRWAPSSSKPSSLHDLPQARHLDQWCCKIGAQGASHDWDWMAWVSHHIVLVHSSCIFDIYEQLCMFSRKTFFCENHFLTLTLPLSCLMLSCCFILQWCSFLFECPFFCAGGLGVQQSRGWDHYAIHKWAMLPFVYLKLRTI